jgi:hypothetical protein
MSMQIIQIISVEGYAGYVQAPLEHHLLQVSAVQWISQVSADTRQNSLGLEVTPFERFGGVYEIVTSKFSA